MEVRKKADPENPGRPGPVIDFSETIHHLDDIPSIPAEMREHLQATEEASIGMAPDQQRTMVPFISHSPSRRQPARPPPEIFPIAAYLFAASVMMITSSMVSTFWLETPLPFCSRFWVLLGGADDCYWTPYPITILAACVAYASAAIWWYRQHRFWRYQNATIASSVLLALVVSLISGMDSSHVLRNTLPWSLYTGLVVSAFLSWRHGGRRRMGGIPLHNVDTVEL